MVVLYHNCFPFPRSHCLRGLLSVSSTCLWKGRSMVDGRAKMAAHFFLACKGNLATRVIESPLQWEQRGTWISRPPIGSLFAQINHYNRRVRMVCNSLLPILTNCHAEFLFVLAQGSRAKDGRVTWLHWTYCQHSSSGQAGDTLTRISIMSFASRHCCRSYTACWPSAHPLISLANPMIIKIQGRKSTLYAVHWDARWYHSTTPVSAARWGRQTPHRPRVAGCHFFDSLLWRWC